MDEDAWNESDDIDGSAESDYDESESSESEIFDEELEAEDERDVLGAELEIEEDFDRLVQNIRTTEGNANSGLLAKDWDFHLSEENAEFKDDLRAASGIGTRKGKKGRRQQGPVLSHQVRALIGEGNQAYVDNNLSEAIRIMQEVIRIEPRAASAWSVLAQCYEDMHEQHRALQLRIMAAHLRHDAEEWDRLATQSRTLGYNQQALYCYRKLYSLDPSNVDTLWERASLAKEMGDFKTARHSLIAILKRFPQDLAVLEELRPILVELNDLTFCVSLYQAAADHYQEAYPLGHAVDPNLVRDSPAGGFGLLHILVLADLYNTLQEHERAIDTIRQGCRWLQGRVTQKFWDVCEDDREYDLSSEGGEEIISRSGDVPPGMYPLDVNARHRLAIARIKLGEVEEGKMHANVVLAQDVLDYAALFGEIADAYFERELYSDAGPIYELLGADAITSSLYVLQQAAICRRMLGDLREAADVYKQVIDADPSNNDAKMKLAEIYEIMDEPRKALELVYSVIDAQKKRATQRDEEVTESSSQTQSASLFEEKVKSKKVTGSAKGRAKLSVPQLREIEDQREKEVLRSWKRIEELWPANIREDDAGYKEAEREWILEAEKLVETFRETRNLFSTTRTQPFRGMFKPQRPRRDEADADRMASRLELMEQSSTPRLTKDNDIQPAKVDVFRGVTFDDWLRMFMQYAFILTKRRQFETADEIIRHMLLSNAYQTRELQDTIRITLIACAIMDGRYSVVVEQCRKLINTHQFNNEAQRILLASLASGLRSTDAFISSTLQKHIFREMKLNDAAVKSPELLKWNSLHKRYTLASTKSSDADVKADEGNDAEDDDGEDAVQAETSAERNKLPQLPTKENAFPVALYGQICTAAKSYQSAIFFLLHAFDYCPDDPTVCLCLGIASVSRAMQRQADNRHHLIAQGMGFLTRYRNLRRSFSGTEQEIEYNFGRAFHQLGLHSHAVKHYDRVLAIAEKQNDNGRSFAREAAYNLSLIYVTTGATPLADALYKRWLSL